MGQNMSAHKISASTQTAWTKISFCCTPKWVKINRRKEERKKKKEESMSNNDWEVRVPPNLITLPGNLMTVINNQEKSESFRAIDYILQCYMHNFKITLRGDESLISRCSVKGVKNHFFC